ncbi:LOG family protein [Candidatus Wolfebacteria bacterium]|nr:LOG family protein [Candidatus Wolfebacteria bacterium]
MDNNNICHTTYKYKICVSGAAETAFLGDLRSKALIAGETLGAEIIKHDAVMLDGATTGFPLWAAKGAKSAGGIVIGLSPASTEKEHMNYFKLPTEHHDIIVYTGFNYSGRNLLLVRSADAVVFGCGRMGTLNEFTITFEDKKPIGVLQGEWETDELIEDLIKKTHRAEEMAGKIVFDSDPKRLIEKLIEVIKKDKDNNNHQALFKEQEL